MVWCWRRWVSAPFPARLVLCNFISLSSTLLPPSSVKGTGNMTKKVLKIAWFPTKYTQAPLVAFSRSADPIHNNLWDDMEWNDSYVKSNKEEVHTRCLHQSENLKKLKTFVLWWILTNCCCSSPAISLLVYLTCLLSNYNTNINYLLVAITIIKVLTLDIDGIFFPSGWGVHLTSQI